MKKFFPLTVYWFLASWLFCMLPIWPLAASGKKGVTLVTGPETADLLMALGEPLQKIAGIRSGEIRFHVLLDQSLNALALPGQHVVLNSGLILSVRDRDELAAVIAHELAHLAAGHHIQLEGTLKDVTLRTMATMAAGIAAGVATGNSQIAQAAIMGGSAASQSTLLDSMRDKETQADRLAIHYLAEAGFDPQGMVRFMERINREQRISNLPPPYLLTHPLSSQRLMEGQQQIDALSSPDEGATFNKQRREQQAGGKQRVGAASQTLEEHQFLLARAQAVLEAGTSSDLQGVLGRFRKQLDLDPDNVAIRYGLAVGQRYMGQLAAAEADLATLLKRRPTDPYLLRERGLVRLEQGKPESAESDFRTALQYQPKKTNADLLYRLAFALHEQEKWPEASRILRPLTLENPLSAEYLYLLGVVEGKQNHLGASHLALARYHYLIAEKKVAKWHYQEAIRQFATGDAGKNIARDEMAKLDQLDKSLFRRGEANE
ncbi:M48 family metalloprotease [Candidatus Magnetaquicoccus inordinatus]|uniref:M48 family metalloprotease n=1 Tax=Candidatus Magnetaquicoccus inordinatus TaxID=2496818 RepID=UPI00187D6953|nr:M48 family metalloprotease [Candidatus Magnetaquicoccus inordinatus]